MKNFDLGLLFIRLGLGVMLIMHGIAKLLNGVGFVKSLLLKVGLPEFIAYFAYLGEVVAPVMLILGIYVRFGSVLILGTCFTILWLFFAPDLFALTSHGGFKAEIVYLYISMALCLLLSGSGRYAIKRD
ncbi:DoxX family protein [Campylobacter mucosalis]|uniref:DoxX family protein n=1 Tax=Campylobacter mucosalis CCUG 21559 TaxID=1032067 RepID=A0A6G5QGC3_9BACT|nr:DoxX family protein [Campylobacter mucosalis]KEA46175.1 DoxX [Campylobacter mucosalis]QCD44659.1 DoxX family protein [Campylobacter mucosalis CCUG 21559]QKF62627.1 DoxX family protein [Campylobacter mucosalis]